ncbi:MAG TPA: hypothetical protein VGL99_07740 [Chloroflexota bacterium]
MDTTPIAKPEAQSATEPVAANGTAAGNQASTMRGLAPLAADLATEDDELVAQRGTRLSSQALQLGTWQVVADRLQGLIAGLVITAPIAPMVAGMLSAALYISPIAGVGPLEPVVAAALYLFVAWGSVATLTWFLGFTSPDRAGMGTYGELIAQLQEIYAWAEWSARETTPLRHGMSLSAWEVARNELVGQVMAIQHERRSRGARWVLATGYMTLWRRLHRAQEALIEIAPSEAVIKYAQYDVLRISNATMARSDTYVGLLNEAIKLLSVGRGVDALLDRLIGELKAVLAALGSGRPGPDIVTTLQDRSAVILLALHALPSTFDNGQLVEMLTAARDRFGDPTFEIDAFRQDLQRALAFLQALASTTLEPGAPAAPSIGLSSPRSIAEATSLVRTIRRMVHDFRDDSRAGLVRARNQLLGTAGLTAITAYALLWLALLSHVPTTAVEAAISFYLIGAIVGLFTRLYAEANSDSGVDDFGLSLTRLLAAPLLSGLASVLGIVLLSMAATTQYPVQDGALSSAFDLVKTPLNLVTAAVFGLTPGLLIDHLTQKTEQYKKDLKSSQPSGGATPA